MLTSSLRHFVRSERFQRQRMDFAAHQIAQRRIYHSMPRQWQLAGEHGSDYGRFEMYAIGAMHVGARAGQTLFDHILDGVRVHRKAGFWRAAGKAGVWARVATARSHGPSYAPTRFNRLQ